MQTTLPKSLKIVTCTSPFELDFAVRQSQALGWNDIDNFQTEFLEIDPNAWRLALTFDREKRGYEVVGCVAGIKYGFDFGYIGFFVLKESLRGKGLSRPLFQSIMEYLAPCHTIGLDAEAEAKDYYIKNGFKPTGKSIRYSFKVSSATKAPEIPRLKIVPLTKENVELLLEYDKKVVGCDRRQLITTFFLSDSGKCWIALSSTDNSVVGYAGLKKCEKGYSIRPLFADDDEVATSLFYYAQQSSAEGEEVYIDIHGVNDAAVEWSKQFKGFELVYEFVQMWTNGYPTGTDHRKMYGRTSIEIGG